MMRESKSIILEEKMIPEDVSISVWCIYVEDVHMARQVTNAAFQQYTSKTLIGLYIDPTRVP